MPWPSDFLACIGDLPMASSELADEVINTVVCVNSHCWSARMRVLPHSCGAQSVAEIWLRHRDSALAMFPEHAIFYVWCQGVRLTARVLATTHAH